MPHNIYTNTLKSVFGTAFVRGQMRHAPESLMQDVTPTFDLNRTQTNYWAVIEFTEGQTKPQSIQVKTLPVALTTNRVFENQTRLLTLISGKDIVSHRLTKGKEHNGNSTK